MLRHIPPLLCILLLAWVVSVLVSPMDPVLIAIHGWAGAAVGVAAYVLGVNIGRQTDPMRPRYLRLRVPRAKEKAHITSLALLGAALTLGPVAWILRDGWGTLGTSTGLSGIRKAFLTGYWGPITLSLLVLTWLTRNRQQIAPPD